MASFYCITSANLFSLNCTVRVRCSRHLSSSAAVLLFLSVPEVEVFVVVAVVVVVVVVVFLVVSIALHLLPFLICLSLPPQVLIQVILSSSMQHLILGRHNQHAVSVNYPCCCCCYSCYYSYLCYFFNLFSHSVMFTLFSSPSAVYVSSLLYLCSVYCFFSLGLHYFRFILFLVSCIPNVAFIYICIAYCSYFLPSFSLSGSRKSLVSFPLILSLLLPPIFLYYFAILGFFFSSHLDILTCRKICPLNDFDFPFTRSFIYVHLWDSFCFEHLRLFVFVFFLFLYKCYFFTIYTVMACCSLYLHVFLQVFTRDGLKTQYY